MSCESREKYLREIALEYDVPVDVVFALAEILGPTEDYDGLISMLEDFEDML